MCSTCLATLNSWELKSKHWTWNLNLTRSAILLILIPFVSFVGKMQCIKTMQNCVCVFILKSFKSVQTCASRESRLFALWFFTEIAPRDCCVYYDFYFCAIKISIKWQNRVWDTAEGHMMTTTEVMAMTWMMFKNVKHQFHSDGRARVIIIGLTHCKKKKSVVANVFRVTQWKKKKFNCHFFSVLTHFVESHHKSCWTYSMHTIIVNNNLVIFSVYFTLSRNVHRDESL